MKNFLFVLLSLTTFAQTEPLKVTINAITAIDSLSFRKFTINYNIHNLTTNKISFFLNPNRVFAGSDGSMKTNVCSTLYQENEELPIHSILSFTSKNRELPIGFENLKEGKEKDEILKKYLKEILKFDIDLELEEIKKTEDETYQIKNSSKQLMESIMTLDALEFKQYTKVFYWDKKRYYKIDEIEYYINEKSNCFLQFYIVPLKEEFKERMTENDFTLIINNPNFIKGWFTSNKMEINFKV